MGHRASSWGIIAGHGSKGIITGVHLFALNSELIPLLIPLLLHISHMQQVQEARSHAPAYAWDASCAPYGSHGGHLCDMQLAISHQVGLGCLLWFVLGFKLGLGLGLGATQFAIHFDCCV